MKTTTKKLTNKKSTTDSKKVAKVLKVLTGIKAGPSGRRC